MVSVETDYIIAVSPKDEKKKSSFESFKISKTYHTFRSLAKALVKSAEAEAVASNPDSLQLLQYAQSIHKLLDSSGRAYLSKVSYDHVKKLANQRSQILNDSLETMLVQMPKAIQNSGVLKILEHFFLTDHVDENSEATKRRGNALDMISKSVSSILPKNTVTPFTKKTREVAIDPNQSEQMNLSVIEEKDDDDGTPTSTRGGDKLTFAGPDTSSTSSAATAGATQGSLNPWNDFLQQVLETTSPIVIGGIVLALLVFLKVASAIPVKLALDSVALLAFGMYCLGLHTSVPTFKKKSSPKSSSRVHRRSLLVPVPKEAASLAEIEDDEQEEDEPYDAGLLKSPLAVFPEGAALGEHLNCWSIPDAGSFKIRGPNYMEDKKKVPSEPFLFKARGMDLMLTDAAPENIGQNSAILGGALREKPTFVMNFRLPWGVVILYFEIPEKIIPFIRSKYEFGYENPDLPKLLEEMTQAEKCCAKFFQADEETKNKLLKIVPVVVKGPWMVKSVVGGKPAIIGKALPVTYVYEKASDNGGALYLEADLDVVSSAAARHILSVVRGATQVLTLDLGFVVQGTDLLPEQMLGAVRCHGIDIYSASPLPPMKSQFVLNEQNKDSSLTVNSDGEDD
eukprot:CAMPEP_0178937796 /NCGR_PEP_ID=MMETSP0786-20121207/25968_1 /TAXON_ID=186022 /ORGANISM="Thalassionema frauenfeldii, Strain CCMP 1798" /LENGTH=623 /DNA_ID=CAMNT_0020616431 /DNA_START=116 /DNA_END=1987 /DNA_ORIENTATION=-